MNKQDIRLKAANLLFDNGCYHEAVIFYWQIIRLDIFIYLEEKEIPFDSTREALKKILLEFKGETDFISKICFYDNIATLSEWDSNFSLTESQGNKMKFLFSEITKKLRYYGKDF